MMIIDTEKKCLTRSDKRAERTRKKLESAALEVFTEYLNDYKEIEDIPELDTDNERVPF